MGKKNSGDSKVNFKHLLWTRLNKDLYNMFKNPDQQVAWMEYRLPIWKQYCLKSILNLDLCGYHEVFNYLVVCDVLTPEYYRNKITDILSDSKILHYDILYVNQEKTTPELHKYVKENYCDKDVLIGTRFDSDDMLRVDFCKKLYHSLDESLKFPYAINFPRGYIYDIRTGSKAISKYEESCPSSISIVNSVKNKSAPIYLSGHGFANTIMPVIQKFKDEEMWVRTVHNKNNSSRMIGNPVGKIVGDFGCVF